MTEVTFMHRDEDGYEVEATAVFDFDGTDAAICNTIRNAIMARQQLELDELDMDEDGTVERNGNTITVTWTGHRNHQSVSTLAF